MVEHLLRGFAPELAEHLEFASLRQLSANWTTPAEQRQGDDTWRVWYADACGRSVVVLVEFQSTVDRGMAARVASYKSMAYDRLRRQGEIDPDGRQRMLAVVIHAGPDRWTASGAAVGVLVSDAGEPLQQWDEYLCLDARRLPVEHLPDGNPTATVLAMEAARSVSEALDLLRSMATWLPEVMGTERAWKLMDAVAEWLLSTLPRRFPDAPSRKAMLRNWTGSNEEKRHMTTLPQRIAEWGDERQQAGWEEGRQAGREEARALLCRQATHKFDAATGQELDRRLRAVSNPERLSEVGAWIIECPTSTELLARVGLP